MQETQDVSIPRRDVNADLCSIQDDCYPFFLDAAKSEIGNQADAFNQLDNKAGVILGFSLVGVVQLFGFTMKSGNPFIDLPLAVSLTALAAALSLLFATLFGVAARWPRDFDDGWSVEKLITKEAQSLSWLQGCGLANLRKAIIENDKVLNSKTILSNTAHFFVILALVLFSSAFLMMAVDGIWTVRPLSKVDGIGLASSSSRNLCQKSFKIVC